MLANTFLKTTKVKVKTPQVTGKDTLNNDIIGYRSETVECIVNDPATDDKSFPRDWYSNSSLKVTFPETLKGSIENCIVVIDGEEYEVEGDPKPVLSQMLFFNRVAIVTKKEYKGDKK